jgi:enamine deaminase RidA (YjgF/YER057c/UK114 family)
MGRELMNPPDLHPAPGFSHIAVGKGERLVFIAGQVALDREFNVVGGDDLGAQTSAAMENVGRALAAAGASWEDVVRRTVYTKQPTEYEVIAKAMEAVQGSDRHPPQTILGVTSLALPELLIEIECTVVIA